MDPVIEPSKKAFPEWREGAVFDARLLRGRGDVRDREIRRLGQAVERWGFFELQNHGIDPQCRQELFAAQRAFFALPDAQKRRLQRTALNARGYNPGELTKNRLDAKEIFDVGHKPDPLAADDALSNRVVDGWNQMPEEGAIRDPIWRWFNVCEPLAIEVYGWLLQALGASDALGAHTDQHTSFLRLNAYSDAQQKNSRKQSVEDEDPDLMDPLGIHRHTDAGLLTLLVEDGHHALQVLHAGQWRMIEPSANAFIVNTGDMLQVLSNDRFIAPEHRVLASVEGQYRLSAAYFFNPPYDQIIQALPANDKDATLDAPRYQSFTWETFRRRRGAGDYEDLGEEIQISHYRVPGRDRAKF